MLNNYTIIDLTHPLDASAPTWTGSCGFSHEVKMDYDKGVRVLAYKMHASIGTHMDAPSHFFKDGKNISDIPLEQLIVPAFVINVTHRATAEYAISLQDIEQFEKKYGPISPNSFVIGYTGWQQYWHDREKYRNASPEGVKRFPVFSVEAARLLLKREIAGIGIDTFSPDRADSDNPVHKCLLGVGKYIIENLTNLDKLPPKGSLAILFPMKVTVGAESPIRAAALVPKKLEIPLKPF